MDGKRYLAGRFRKATSRMKCEFALYDNSITMNVIIGRMLKFVTHLLSSVNNTINR